MKTTLKEQLNSASTAIRTQGQKAFKHPITSILSLCLVAGIAATIAGFSQAPTEKNVAKDADLRGLQTVSLSLKSAEHTPAEFRILFMRILSENRNDLIFRLAVHELNSGANPYVTGIMKKSATDFIMVSIPKGMIDKGWEKIESAPKTDFATKWGVEIPNPPTARTVQMNVTRNITAKDGRSMDGTIISKDETGIKFKKGLKEYDISYQSLSEDDVLWIKEAKGRPLKIVTVGRDKYKFDKLIAATTLPQDKIVTGSIDKDSDIDLKVLYGEIIDADLIIDASNDKDHSDEKTKAEFLEMMRKFKVDIIRL